MNKYLSMNPVPWLTDGENPAVRYLVKKEILDNQDNDQIYNELLNSDLTGYFKKQAADGVMGDSEHIDIFYKGSVWFFLVSVESGYKNTEFFISKTADYLCDKTQLKDGGFKFNYRSPIAAGCRTGNMVYSLIKCGINDSRTENGLKWIKENQRNDGGWLHCPAAGLCDVMKLVLLNKPGNGLKHEKDQNVSSCPVASYYCLKALDESGRDLFRNSIDNGAGFFIRNGFFIKSKNGLMCGNRVNFKKIGYPVMSQYDYLSGLILVSGFNNYLNAINGDFFNSIIKKQNSDGSWNSENMLDGMIKENQGKSRWTTLNAIRLINIIVKNDNQYEKV